MYDKDQRFGKACRDYSLTPEVANAKKEIPLFQLEGLKGNITIKMIRA